MECTNKKPSKFWALIKQHRGIKTRTLGLTNQKNLVSDSFFFNQQRWNAHQQTSGLKFHQPSWCFVNENGELYNTQVGFRARNEGFLAKTHDQKEKLTEIAVGCGCFSPFVVCFDSLPMMCWLLPYHLPGTKKWLVLILTTK